MRKETAGALLAIIFILFAGFRIAIAFSEPTLTYDGYLHLRHVEHIAQTGLPLFDDPLSYGGRVHINSPFYHYLLAPFALFFPPEIVLKFVPNLLFATTMLFVYFIVEELTRSRGMSLLAAAIAGFTPIIFSQYINDANPLSLAIPLMLLTVYALMNIKKRLPMLLVCGVIGALISPIFFILLLGIGLYLIIAALERLPIERPYIEVLVFLLFFTLWSTLILFKEPFLQYGFAAVYAYLPVSLLKTYFSEFTIVSAVATIGIIPIAFGGAAAYSALFTTRIRKVLLVSSLTAAAAIALFLRLIDVRTGMLVLALFLCILAGQGFKLLSRYFDKTRIPRTKYLVITIIIFFFLFASALPALSTAGNQAQDAPSYYLIGSLNWLRDNTPPDARVLATPKEGFAIEYVAQRPTVIDRDFLLVNNIDELYDDIELIYRSQFALPALNRLNRHGVDYILFSKNAQKTYLRHELAFTEHECFRQVFENEEVHIYEVLCDVRTE